MRDVRLAYRGKRVTQLDAAETYAELKKIEVPFVVVQNLGYFNLHQFGCYDLFQNAGTRPITNG